MNMRPIDIKEQHYGTRINYVVVRSPAGGDRAVVPVPCYLASAALVVSLVEGYDPCGA